MLQLTRSAALGLITLSFMSGTAAYGAELCATVVDYARLPLPSASVNATNLATGKSYGAQTDKSGSACLAGLPEGLYAVEASLTGFLHVKYYPVRTVSRVKQMLSFALPFAEISEGGLGDESTLTGTLLKAGIPLESAEVCIIGGGGVPRTCTTTNDLGEYALVGPSGVYQTEVRTRGGQVYKSKIDMSAPGIYRNRLSIDAGAEKQ